MSVAEVCVGVECMSIDNSGVSSSMDVDVSNSVGFNSVDIHSIPTAPPLTIDSNCLSPEHSTKYYNTVTSPTTTNNNTNTLTTTNTTTPTDTSLLISSQWAMEALKLRREAQTNVEHKLHRIREKRTENEARARGRARSSIGQF